MKDINLRVVKTVVLNVVFILLIGFNATLLIMVLVLSFLDLLFRKLDLTWLLSH